MREHRPQSGVTGSSVRRWTLLAALLLLVAVALAVVRFSPLLSVRDVRVTGAETVSRKELLDAVAVPHGTPLFGIESAAAARRCAGIARVARCRVAVEYPSTILVEIAERSAVLYFESPQGSHLLDSEGVEFAVGAAPQATPKLVTAHPGSADAATRAALAVVVAAPDKLRAQIRTVTARSVSDIDLTMRDGKIVEWGGASESERKAAITGPLLTRPGTRYDVSSPDLPTVK
ncbi:MAG: FtsQ-type POTRA domain-containing protein [Mycobacteriaceae bacterium]|nr:FtsQ-type POTRA domain-containing protein [Mycobacteriaceae bacterium]